MSAGAAGRAGAWDAARRETVELLTQLIRLDTVNPPGNEIRIARYLERTFALAHVETTLHEPAPGRAALIARLRGTGAAPPVLLLAHMDVVGVEREHWSTDPFGAEIRDGYLYGRGAIDDKGMLAANVETMLLLARAVLERGGTLERDVVFVATSDEETGGAWGIEWLLDAEPELARAEFALNEGGRLRVVGGRPLYLAVQCAEKVPHNVRVTARGPAGHASVPLPENAIVRLARALGAIGAHREPMVLTPTTRAFFHGLSVVWPDADEARAMRDLVAPEATRAAAGARALATRPAFDALLRNGISPTIVAGGTRSNVIPSEVTATLNVRLLPGERLDGVLERLRGAVNDPLVTLEAVGHGGADARDSPSDSPSDSPMFEAIADALHALDPSIVVVPYLSAGATDSARLRARGVAAYGVLPFPLEQEDEARMHGHDERIPLASLDFGTRLIHGAIARVAGARVAGARVADAHGADAHGAEEECRGAPRGAVRGEGAR